MKLRRLVSGALVLALLCALLAALVLARGGEWLRAAAEQRLQALVQPQVRIGEAVRWQLRPGPDVRLRALALRGDDGEPVLRIDEIALTWSWRDVLAGRLEAGTLSVSGVRVSVQRDADGHWNVADWVRGTGPAEGRATSSIMLPALAGVRFEDVRIDLRDESGGLEGALVLSRLELGAVQAAEPLGLSADLQLMLNAPAEVGVQGTLEVALTPGLRALEALDARLEAESGAWRAAGAHLQVDRMEIGDAGELALSGGELAADIHGPDGMNGHGRLSVERFGQDARGWYGAGSLGLETEMPVQARLSSGFTVGAEESGGTLEGELMGAGLNGNWRHAALEQPPSSLLLSLEHLDLDALSAALPGGGEEGTAPAWLDWSAWPVNGELRVGTLRAQGATVRGARVRLGALPAR
ncbi:hypothetical protein E6C76_11745 [Pseudothauera nasutitermitis]|uniref:AsmA domain-containing protein n=1 Tax=Pseudothauera nasutitermitis TaxID=2565930 RepID=A0A4S4AYG8_9RHOO|nr:hypothetical protein [Pseudothauera nasutitermitis]THF64716.1 hypothetical protein E6C76_11745 [Pseudothauera nasutitermitis]